MSETGYVYFITDEKANAVKVGKAKDPRKRLVSMQTGNVNILKLIYWTEGYTELEREIHLALDTKGLRIRGEWFTLPTDAESLKSELQTVLNIKSLRTIETISLATQGTEYLLTSMSLPKECIDQLRVSMNNSASDVYTDLSINPLFAPYRPLIFLPTQHRRLLVKYCPTTSTKDLALLFGVSKGRILTDRKALDTAKRTSSDCPM